MRKNFLIYVFISFTTIFLFNMNVKAENTYIVNEVRSDGILTQLSSTEDYNEAKQVMNNHNSSSDCVAVLYKNGHTVNAKYAVVKFKPEQFIKLYQNRTDSSYYTYMHTSYGMDAAFIDYDPNTNRVKLKISGFTGWTDLGSLIIDPITNLYANNLRITENIVDALNVRSEPSSSGNYIGYVTAGQVFSYTETRDNAGYTWYKINYNGGYGWIANVDNGIALDGGTNLRTYYQYWEPTGNLLHYFSYYNSGDGQTMTNLGPAPSFLNPYQTYYSFDGNYFYDDVVKMLDDYRNDIHDKAVNSRSPYYAYYLYLPNKSQTSYTANDLNMIISQKGYNSKPNDAIRYVDDYGNFIGGIDRNGISQLVGEGQSFIDSQNKYGTNALLSFSAALNESANGTSAIAIAKKNLFGHNAYDSCPFSCATTYQTVYDSIIEHARLTGENYNNPNELYYHGSHYGNKGSGMNVMYASDPYWGEKAAQNYFFADNAYGKADYLYNTIGIKTSFGDVFVYAEPNLNSKKIYNINNSTENVANVPLIVIDKVQANDRVWYKVYTEVGLDSNKNIVSNYNREYSFGYVLENELYVSNNQPKIIGKDIVTNVGQAVDLLSGVTAIDTENGDLTNKITYDSNVDFNKAGEYYVTYSVLDRSNFKGSSKYKITVEEKLANIDNDTAKNILEQISVDKEKRDARFYLDYLKNIDGSLYIKGYNTIVGMDNNLSNNINYKVVFENIETNEILSFDATRILDRNSFNMVPFSTDGYDYTYSWFEYKFDFKNLPNGNYKTYVLAYTDNYYSLSVVSNKLYKEQATSYVGDKSVIIYRNFSDRTGALEFNVRQNTLAVKNGSHIYNQYDTYRVFEFNENKLHLKGVSYSYGMDLSPSSNVTRKIIFENKDTFNTYSYDLGSTTDGLYKVLQLVDDNFDKSRAWYDNYIDISNIEKGEYVIYLTTTSNITDIAELTEKLGRSLDNVKLNLNGLNYSFIINHNKGNRIELIVD